MKAKLYGPLNNYLGSAELPDTRMYPKVIMLGKQLFQHRDNGIYLELLENDFFIVSKEQFTENK